MTGRRLKYEALEERVALSAENLFSNVASTSEARFEEDEASAPPFAAALPIDQWVQSLVYQQFNQLLPEHVPYLTLQQVASIPEIFWFSQIRPESRAALSAQQVQALNVRDVTLTHLTPQQVSWLTVSQIQSLTLFDFKYLSASQIPWLTPAQIATIPDPWPLTQWTAAARAALTAPQIQALRVSEVRLDQLTPQQVSWLTTSQVQSLKLHDFKYLSASQIPWLTPAQIATIPDPGPFAEWTSAARAALTAPQVQALRVSTVRLDRLTPQQVSWLTVSQIQSLTLFDFKYLSASQIPWLTPAQIATIPDPWPLTQWTAAARAALTAPQIQALRVSEVRLDQLTPQQVSWLTTSQVQSLKLHDFKYLSASQIPWLTPAQIATIPDPGPFAEWTSAARAALTAPQVQALRVSTVRLDRLTPQQVSWLTVSQIQSLTLFDFKYLSASQIPWLTPAQIATIPDPGPLAQWTAAARAALTSQQIPYLNVRTIGLSLLTSEQILSLKRFQIQSLQRQEFGALHPHQIPHLTPAQIAALPDRGLLSTWSPEARAALTQPQIQWLRVEVVHLDLLTPQQVSWLTVSQIQSLTLFDFKYLSASQIPWLTPAQIATIPDPWPLTQWTAAARAALTAPQIQALRVSEVRLDQLTPQQVSWLTTSQVQSLKLHDFKYLSASQIPWLTPAQIATIPDPGPFAEWTSAARAALTAPQVQALRVSTVRLDRLTPQQVSWLTVSQIQSLTLFDFKYLSASQIPWLTPAQIATIPDPGPLAQWTAAARAALTAPQIRALNVADVRVYLLTRTQIGWLTSSQVASLRWEDFFFLNPDQIQFIPPANFATIPSGLLLRSMPDELQVQFTRAQLLALSPTQWAEFNSAVLTSPSDYVPTVDIPTVNGVPATHLVHLESQRVLDLVPIAAATHVAVASGDWSNPAVWRDGRLPTAGARVLISAGTVVRYNVMQSVQNALDTLRIDGTLTFATTINTQLAADTIVVSDSGQLHVGTSSAPIADGVTARIVIASDAPINTVRDPYLLSRGVLSMGEVRMHGVEVTPFASLLLAPTRGATELTLSQVPTNWRVGDEIVLTGTHPYVTGNQTERLTIRAVNGRTIVVDPLAYDHVPPPGYALSVYVANLSRNVQLTASDSSSIDRRPHLMFLHNPNVQIANVSVTGFGRTDKSTPINDPVVVNGVLTPGTGLNARARYAMHFHHTGVNPTIAPAVVRGSVIDGSPGWGFVNHSSNVVMERNIAFEAFGAGFTTEDGNEIGVMRGNLSLNSYGSGDHLQSREYIHDFGHGGHGFWLQGPGVEVVDNVAAGNGDAAFLYFTSSTKTQFDAVNLDDPALAEGHKATHVGAVPLKRFSGNTALNSKSGLEIWFNQTRMTGAQSLIENFTAWGMRASGIDLRYVGSILIRDSLLLGDLQVFRGFGVGANQETGDVVLQNLRIEGFERGIIAPPRRTNAIIGGVINAVVGISITGANDTVRSLSIFGGTVFLTATPAQLGNRPQFAIYADASIDFTKMAQRRLAAIFAEDDITYSPSVGVVARLYFAEQAAGYVPFPAYAAAGYVPDEFLDLTNEELREYHSVSLGGGYPAWDAVVSSGIRAWLDFSP